MPPTDPAMAVRRYDPCCKQTVNHLPITLTPSQSNDPSRLCLRNGSEIKAAHFQILLTEKGDCKQSNIL